MPDTHRRGRPPRIDRARIVAAARDMDPATLTMQAVAERLGVDRKALNYHVTGRDNLLELVARETLSASLESFTLPLDAPWPDMLRAFARQTRASMIKVGAHFDYVRFPLGAGLAALAPVELLLRALLDAGFGEEQAGRVLGLLGELTYASARDAILLSRHGLHPQIAELRNSLVQSPPGMLPSLRHLSTTEFGMDDAQFDFDLDVIIAGLSALRADR
ncbi:TetR/AcrR family transcriptional regulator C-terminal domain-containing protein [Paractinoplanes durhamensis]|nr:TetR/AcrR family transcriptional regulator C-terminal domain-containing protein [Actinoplanes durhamensis]